MIALALLCPLAMLLACAWAPARRVMPRLLVLAPLPALLAALLGGRPLVLGGMLVRIVLDLDPLGAMLVAVAALLWMAGGATASGLAEDKHAGRFAAFWLLTLIGSLAVFMAADLAGFFLAYTIVSLAGWGLVLHDETARARRAAGVYVTFAVLGEGLLLLALVLLAAASPGERLLIRDAVDGLARSPWAGPTLAAIIAGFGMKMALVPLHGWMPLTYRAAPIPAAAVLSGAGVKAGVIGLLRFLPPDVAWPAAGETLAILGFASAFYGVAIGVTQRHAKTVLGYSSISQMGVIAALAGLALMAGTDGRGAIGLYAVHHLLAKGALFLAIGVAMQRRGTAAVLVPAALVALGMGGLPLTGGAVAKLATKDLLGDDTAKLLGYASAVGTTLLMVHFLRLLHARPFPTPTAFPDPQGIPPPWVREGLGVGSSHPQEQAANHPLGQNPGVATHPPLTPPFQGGGSLYAWYTTAIAALIIPWLVYPGPRTSLLSAAALWDSAWPVALGALLAIPVLPLAARITIPEGDLLTATETAFARTTNGRWLDRLDAILRLWPAAGLSLAAIVLVLAALVL